MGKYEPLESFLAGRGVSEVPVTFGDIERVLGAPLPATARAHRAWWSNNPSNNVMTKAWLAAGYKTERVDMARGKLVFVRSIKEQDDKPVPSAFQDGFLARFERSLLGTVKIAEGVDITAPTGEIWDAEL